MIIYLVEACRQSNKLDHYLVGLKTGSASAEQLAMDEYNYRGMKYDIIIYPIEVDQLYECEEHYNEKGRDKNYRNQCED